MMQINRPKLVKPVISLVPMIDVMMILLVFFMVTSTYLDLDMIPMIEDKKRSIEPAGADIGPTLLIQLTSGGETRVAGQMLNRNQLAERISQRLDVNPLTSIILLPSGAATTQQLVATLEVAKQAGATRLRLIKLEARP